MDRRHLLPLSVTAWMAFAGCPTTRPVATEPTGEADCLAQEAPACLAYAFDADAGSCDLEARPTGTACDDGDPCTTEDVCVGHGQCFGTTTTCPASSTLCHVSICGEEGACADVPSPDAACEDGNPCTVGDACDSAGVCAAGEDVCGACDPEATAPCDAYIPSANRCLGDVVCTAEGQCVFDEGTAKPPCDTSGDTGCQTTGCDPGTGECVTVLAPAGTPCEDGLPCTTAGLCDGAGQCEHGEPLVCEASESPCIDTICAVLGGAEGCFDLAQCECTTDEDCPQPPVGCLQMTCLASTCRFEPREDGAYDCDGVACTVGDTCTGGVCFAGDDDCDDGNPCTADACITSAGLCTHIPLAGACDDGDPCTADDQCTELEGCRGEPLDCDDGNPCTKDDCESEADGCTHEPKGGECDDDNPCTPADFCNEGTCHGGGNVCSDDDPCTADACDPADGSCSYTTVSAECDDGDACTTPDVCVDGECISGSPLDCDDLDACTLDLCDDGVCDNQPIEGCCHTPDDCPDDGNPCTTPLCEASACTTEPVPGCCQLPDDCPDDGDPCTAPECTDNACIHANLDGCCELPEDCPAPAAPCTAATCIDNTCGEAPVEGCCTTEADCQDDDDACTAPTCQGGTCAHDPLPDCCNGDDDCPDDGHVCTLEHCFDHACQTEAIEACCEDIDDCPPPSTDCTEATCEDTTCGEVAIASCCASEADCEDDGDPCTATACTDAACAHEPIEGCCALPGDCADDGDVCTEAACDGNNCAHEPIDACCELPTDCTDDGDVCTEAACDGNTCSHEPIDSCCELPGDCDDDGDVCTEPACNDNACSHEPVDGCCELPGDCADDGDVCTEAACDDNACSHEPIDGCCELPGDCADDGDVCTEAACSGNECVHEAIDGCCEQPTDCDDDGDICTEAACDDNTCSHEPIAGCCELPGDCADDGDVCTDAACNDNTCSHEPTDGCCENPDECPAASDACHEVTCVADACGETLIPGCCTTVDDCDDDDPCTDDSCPTPGGSCEHESVSCEDDDLCTEDQCDLESGDCLHPAVACPDSTSCLDVTCEPATGCTETPLEGPCDDEDPCTEGDSCSEGACVGGSAVTCDDGGECAIGECLPSEGCQYTASDGPCDDGNPCTTDEQCVGGACTAGIRSLAVSSSNVCVICGSGTLRCWGSNAFGVLVPGGASTFDEPQTVALDIEPVEVVLGEFYGCARSITGAVSCWGSNNKAQLGRGFGEAGGFAPAPVVDSTGDPLAGVTAIAAGEDHVCAVAAAGQVLCWGDNDSAQSMPGGSTTTDVVAATPVPVAPAASVATGGVVSCATLLDGGVACWGHEKLGDETLGNGSGPSAAGTIATVLAPDGVQALDGAAGTAAGDKHACTRLDDGGVVCWGGNNSGESGASPPFKHPVPIGIEVAGEGSSLDGAASLSLGGCHSCVLVDTCDTACWGCNDFDQVSPALATDADAAVPFALPAAASGTVTRIVAGGSATCLAMSNGDIICQGSPTHLLGPTPGDGEASILEAALVCPD